MSQNIFDENKIPCSILHNINNHEQIFKVNKKHSEQTLSNELLKEVYETSNIKKVTINGSSSPSSPSSSMLKLAIRKLTETTFKKAFLDNHILSKKINRFFINIKFLK